MAAIVGRTLLILGVLVMLGTTFLCRVEAFPESGPYRNRTSIGSPQYQYYYADESPMTIREAAFQENIIKYIAAIRPIPGTNTNPNARSQNFFSNVGNNYGQDMTRAARSVARYLYNSEGYQSVPTYEGGQYGVFESSNTAYSSEQSSVAANVCNMDFVHPSVVALPAIPDLGQANIDDDILGAALADSALAGYCATSVVGYGLYAQTSQQAASFLENDAKLNNQVTNQDYTNVYTSCVQDTYNGGYYCYILFVTVSVNLETYGGGPNCDNCCGTAACSSNSNYGEYPYYYYYYYGPGIDQRPQVQGPNVAAAQGAATTQGTATQGAATTQGTAQ